MKIFTADNPANPIRLVKIQDYDPGKYFYRRFDGSLAINLIPSFQKKQCYFQKYTTQDKPVIQILSDFEDITCKLFDLNTGLEVEQFAVNEVPTNILNQTFKCYQAEIDFSIINEGQYELQVSYIDDLLETITYYSEPIDVKEIQENTILIEYQNTENNFSMVLGNVFKGILRVEGAILNFKPASDDVVYNDQKRNSTTLYSLPYQQYELFIGAANGVPDWMVDKVNRTFSFNILSLDGVYYNKIEGAKFEESRTEDYPFSGQTIEIMPVENKFLQQLNTSNIIPEDESMIQYQKVLKYVANGDDIEIPGIFKNGTILEKILIINRSIDFTINISTESTGSNDDINIDYDVQGITNTLVIDQLFSEVKNINITGLDGFDTDVYVVYKDLLAKPSGTPNGYIALGIGAVVIYEEQNAGDYDIDFNFATGLGRVGTQWEGWAICDGRNGTQDRGGRFPIGFKQGSIFEALINNIGGSFTFKITTTDQFPFFRLKVFSPVQVNNGAPNLQDQPDNRASWKLRDGSLTDNYNMKANSSEATLGTTSGIGKETPDDIEHVQPYIVSLFVKKIAEIA